MADEVVGRGIVELTADATGLGDALKGIVNVASGAFGDIGKILAQGQLSALAVAGAAAAGAALLGGAMLSAAKSASEYVNELGRVSAITGVSIEDLSGLGYAAHQSDVEFGALRVGLTQLNKAIAGTKDESGLVSDGLEKLGVSAKNADGSLRPARAVLGEVLDKLREIRDPAERAAGALGIFGKSGLSLLPMVEGGSAGLERMTDQAERFGTVVGGEAAEAAQRFEEATKASDQAIKGVSLSIGQSALPVFSEMRESFVAFMESNSEWIRMGLSGVFSGFGSVLGDVAKIIGAGLLPVVVALGLALFGIVGVFKLILDTAKVMFAGLAFVVGTVLGGIANGVAAILDYISPEKAAAIRATVTDITGGLEIAFRDSAAKMEKDTVDYWTFRVDGEKKTAKAVEDVQGRHLQKSKQEMDKEAADRRKLEAEALARRRSHADALRAVDAYVAANTADSFAKQKAVADQAWAAQVAALNKGFDWKLGSWAEYDAALQRLQGAHEAALLVITDERAKQEADMEKERASAIEKIDQDLYDKRSKIREGFDNFIRSANELTSAGRIRNLEQDKVREIAQAAAQLTLVKGEADKEAEIRRGLADKLRAIDKGIQSETVAMGQQTRDLMNQIAQGIGQVFSAIMNLAQTRSQAHLRKIKTQQDQETADLEKAYADRIRMAELHGLDTTKIEEQKDAAMLALEERHKKASLAAQKAAFKSNQKAQIATAIVNTAASVVIALATGGDIYTGIIMAVVAAALGGIQIAAIKAQKFEGQAHDGSLSLPNSGSHNMQGGEFVADKNSGPVIAKFAQAVASGQVRNVGGAGSGGGGGETVVVVKLDDSFTRARGIAREIGAMLTFEVQNSNMRLVASDLRSTAGGA